VKYFILLFLDFDGMLLLQLTSAAIENGIGTAGSQSAGGAISARLLMVLLFSFMLLIVLQLCSMYVLIRG
jgi:hypothetical protein